jgi:tRNA(fMet)-specific endonuclease VapC
MYYLDSNTCIYFLNGRSTNVRDKILATSPNEIAIPSIVKAELILGAYKSLTPEKTLEKLENFLQPFEIIPFEDQVSYQYAEIRKSLEVNGTIIGPNDLIIAAITKYHDAILITNNTKEFKRVENLKIENWIL